MNKKIVALITMSIISASVLAGCNAVNTIAPAENTTGAANVSVSNKVIAESGPDINAETDADTAKTDEGNNCFFDETLPYGRFQETAVIASNQEEERLSENKPSKSEKEIKPEKSSSKTKDNEEKPKETILPGEKEQSSNNDPVVCQHEWAYTDEVVTREVITYEGAYEDGPVAEGTYIVCNDCGAKFTEDNDYITHCETEEHWLGCNVKTEFGHEKQWNPKAYERKETVTEVVKDKHHQFCWKCEAERYI